MAWKKAEESYFADSFNRDATLNCCYTIADSAVDGWVSATKGIAIDDLCGYANTGISANTGTISASTCGIGGYDIATVADIDSVTTSISDLVKRIELLESSLKAPQSELRRTLKTLQYKREVE